MQTLNEPETQNMIGDFAPKLLELTDKIIFGDLWKREDISIRDRSLITISCLITIGNVEQLKFHLGKAKENGITEKEVVEVITHLAFYAGWPKAVSAIKVAKDFF